MNRWYVLAVLLLLVACGCRRSAEIITHSHMTNYRLGETKTAYVGQKIVAVKDYYAPVGTPGSSTTHLSALEGFSISAKAPAFPRKYNWQVFGNKGDRFASWVKATVDGEEYDVIYPVDKNGYFVYGVLINKKGEVLKGKGYYGKVVEMADYASKPENITFAPADVETVTLDENCSHVYTWPNRVCGHTNYELIYAGINNVTMNLNYREFTRQDWARPSFFQSLVYQTNANVIRFKDFQLQILEATNEKLTYRVLSDGLTRIEFPDGYDPVYEKIKYDAY